MKKYKLQTNYKKLLADTLTPVSVYLKLRDKFDNCIMLESSDYHGNDDSYSYICFDPIARFQFMDKELECRYPDNTVEKKTVQEMKEVKTLLNDFSSLFDTETFDHKFISNGMFGYMGYDAVQCFEDISFEENDNHQYRIPEVLYSVYRYVIAMEPFKNELHLFEHNYDHEESRIDEVLSLIDKKEFPAYSFSLGSEESSNFTDDEFLKVLQKGKDHCFRGDVFQIVLSRRFQTSFKGDEFNVYRVLRSINPSPYLFYFDYGNFKIFGSSPEAQIVIGGGEATIYPIAGTFLRTGNDTADRELASKLYDDPKENSEHVMLVDLARNDLSRNSDEVKVETFKDIQYYSHVIHLVSKVTGILTEETTPIDMVAETFPAGTLSGAPKHMAMQLINRYESVRRGYYGGAIGYMGFNGDFNHAIMIRSFLSKENVLYYQAGAGVVAKSNVPSELQEVNNKLAALRQAIKSAEEVLG